MFRYSNLQLNIVALCFAYLRFYVLQAPEW